MVQSNEQGGDEQLREKLATIEHERWSDWQNYTHKVYLEGNFQEFMLRWQRQINTPYAELSEAEKASDMEQVDRYWQLILADRKQHELDATIAELELLRPRVRHESLLTIDQVINARVAELKAERNPS